MKKIKPQPTHLSQAAACSNERSRLFEMLRFYTPNLTCGGCAKSVAKALLSVDPQARIEADPPTREGRVDSALDESAFLAVLSEAGYPDKQ